MVVIVDVLCLLCVVLYRHSFLCLVLIWFLLGRWCLYLCVSLMVLTGVEEGEDIEFPGRQSVFQCICP